MGVSTTKRGNTKENIRNQAIKLFKEYGYENVTVVQICEASGVTKRTFYYHFSSKEEIVDGIIGRVGQKTELMTEAMLNQETNVGILWAMMKGYAIEAEENGPVITSQVFINILQRGAESTFPQEMVLFKAAVRNIANAQLASEISNMQPAEEVAYALYHCLRSTAYTWCSCAGRYSLLGEYKRVFQALLGFRIPPEKVFGRDAR